MVALMSINIIASDICSREKYFEEVMHQQKYFTLNIFINEAFSVEKFPNYSISLFSCLTTPSLPQPLMYHTLIMELKFMISLEACM